MKDVVLPKKEEFRYLLYFCTAQDKEVGIDILTRMSQSYRLADQGIQDEKQMERVRQRERDFLVDVAFECHEREAAEVVKTNGWSDMTSLTIHREMTAHTLAGYKFVQPDFIQNLVSALIFRMNQYL